MERQAYLPRQEPEYLTLHEYVGLLNLTTGRFAPNLQWKLFINLLQKIGATVQNLIGREFYVRIHEKHPVRWDRIFGFLKGKGLIDRYVLVPQYNDYPKLHEGFFLVPDVTEKTDGYRPRNAVFHNAASLDVNTMFAKMTGEFLERFFLFQYRERMLHSGSYDDMRRIHKQSLNPNLYANVCCKRNNKKSDLSHDRFLWAEGRELLSDKPAFIPAQLIFWTYRREHSGWTERFLSESNTNGGAAGATLEEALLSGIYEAVERDGFLGYWLNTVSPQVINLDSLEMLPSVRKILADCRRYDLEVHILNTMTDIEIPSCVAVVIDNSRIGPKVSVGAGCAATWDDATTSALIEALKLKRAVRDRMQNDNTGLAFLPADASPEEMRKFNQHSRVSLWANESMFEHFRFFINGGHISLDQLLRFELKFPTLSEELGFVGGQFRKLGYDVYYYEASNPVLETLRFRTVKVVIPHLIPFYLSEVNRPFGCERLKDAPRIFKGPVVLNNFPHPFS